LTDRSIKNINMSPRTKEQFEIIREEKSLHIMQSALEVFAEYGYANSTISQIARHASISKGLLYNYFESKEALIDAIINRGFDEMLALYDPDNDGVITVDEMENYIRQVVAILKERRIFWKLYYQLSMQPDVFKRLEVRIMEMMEPIMKMTVAYFESMGFENPLMETMIFSALMDGVAIDYVMAPELFPIDDLLEEIVSRYCKKQTI
jgi:AcrR family transcriptional regulator